MKLALLVILGLGLVWHFLGVNATDEHGMTALMLAAGANPNAVDESASSYTALKAAKSGKHMEVAPLLETAGAKK